MKEKLNEPDSDDNFMQKLASDKWVEFFSSCKNSEQYSELLKIVQFYFCSPAERIFSIMNAQCTGDRNRLKIESIRAILVVQ